jgi:hypothetical protein
MKTNDPQELLSTTIATSLQQISNVLALFVVNLEINKDKTQLDLVKILLNLGYDRSQIALVLNTSVATITARIADLKKKGVMPGGEN